MKSGAASRTAVFVCQGRAAAHGRLAVGRFSDPVAEQLLRDDELAAVRAVRADAAPVNAAERMAVEGVRACADVVAPRTVVIDEAVAAAVQAGTGQVVVVGAGLDTRPWRLSVLGGATVFAVDHPASQADTRDRSAGLVPVAARMQWVPVDLTVDPLGAALATAGHDGAAPTVWVWEGVVPYLVRADVEATVAALAARSAPGSVLVVNYQTPSVTARAGRWLAAVAGRVSGGGSVTADEPWRSLWTPSGIAALLGRHGFTVHKDVDLLQVAQDVGSPTGHGLSLRNGRVAVAHHGG